ncbi:5114_t:CDS:1 [Ambispora leptoticha]|uniref:5114_t:CDS:1 n=1 Tax=Ambispora leptoticha TaxID=144679 RepID=A0A9N8ZFN5_9GLOM|nr:5114_t:CDS:1 [Ambispora leptoticha]
MHISCLPPKTFGFKRILDDSKRHQIKHRNLLLKLHQRSCNNNVLGETATSLSRNAPVIVSFANIWRTGSCNSNATDIFLYMLGYKRRKVSHGNFSQRQPPPYPNTCAAATFERILVSWQRGNRRKNNFKRTSRMSKAQFLWIDLNFYKLSLSRSQLKSRLTICSSHLLSTEIPRINYKKSFSIMNLPIYNLACYSSKSSRSSKNKGKSSSLEETLNRQLQNNDTNIGEIWTTYMQIVTNKRLLNLSREQIHALMHHILRKESSIEAIQKLSTMLDHMRLHGYEILQDEHTFLIEAYVGDGNLEDARALFDQIYRMNPSCKAANSMIEAYEKENNLDQVEDILKMMKKEEIVGDSITKKTLIRIFTKNMSSGSISNFNQLVKRQLVDADLAREVLIGYAKNGLLNEALELYFNMRASELQIELDDYLMIINGLNDKNQTKEALWMIDELISSKLVLNEEACEVICDLYLSTSNLDKNYEFLVRMLKKGYKMDIRMFNKLIDRYSSLGKVNSTLSLVTRMKESGIEPDYETYTSMLRLFTNVNDTDAMEKVFNRMVQEGFDPNIAVYNLLTTGYSRTYNVSKAFEVCRTMLNTGIEPNEFTYNGLISLFAERSDPIGATLLFNEMKAFDIRSNVYTYTSLIKAYAWTKDINGAEKIMRNMRISGIEPNEVTYNIIMNAYSKNNDFDSVRSIFQEMLRLNLKPNSHTYSCLMEGFCRVGNLKAAESLLAKVKESSAIKPEVHLYTILINAYAKQKNLTRVFEIYEDMIKQKIEPTHFTYAILINGNARIGKIDFARKLLSELIEQSKKIARFEEIQWRDRLPAHVFTPLMDAYAKQGQFEEAKEIFAEMIAQGIRPQGHAYTILMDACRTIGDYEGVWNIWQAMRKDLESEKLAESSSSFSPNLKSIDSSNERLIKGSSILESIPKSNPITPPPHAISILFDALMSSKRYDLVEKEWQKLQSEGFPFDSDNLNKYVCMLILSRKIIQACNIIKDRLIQGWDPKFAFWRLEYEKPLEVLRSQKNEALARKKAKPFYPQKKTLLLLWRVLEDMRSGKSIIINDMLEETTSSNNTDKSIVKIQTLDDILRTYPELVFAAQRIAKVEEIQLRSHQYRNLIYN